MSVLFYLPQAVATWVVAIWLIEWRRLRELFVYGLFGALVCCVEDKLGRTYGLWEYRDTGPFDTHAEISILITFSAAPLFAIYSAQGLKREQPIPWTSILLITAVAMVPETVGIYTGNIVHGRGWNFWWSVLAHLLVWMGMWGVHRWLNGTPPPGVPRQAPEGTKSAEGAP